MYSKKKGGTNVNKLTPKFFSVTIEAKDNL